MSPETLTPRPEIPAEPVDGMVLRCWTVVTDARYIGASDGVLIRTYVYDAATKVWHHDGGWSTTPYLKSMTGLFWSEQDAIDAFVAWGHKRVEALRREASDILAMMLNRGRRPAGGSR